MRVLLITDWMRHAGGAERYVACLRAGLAAAGDEVRLLTSSVGSAAEGSAEHVAWGAEALALQSVLQIANPFAFACAEKAVRELAPDVAVVNMFANHLSPAVFAPLRNLPVIVLATDFKLVCPAFAKLLPNGETCREPAGAACLRRGCLSLPHWLRDQPRYALIRRALGRASRVLACSEAVHCELARNGIASVVLPLPVDAPGADFRRRPAATPLFVFSGRLAAQKGVLTLARVFARLLAERPDARLRYVGGGPEEQELATVVETLGIGHAVELVGWVAPARVEEFLADAWAAVAPTRGPEPLGLVALEAIVRGVPVIATRNGGFLETVDEGRSGLLCADGDEAALLDALRAVAARSAFPDLRVTDEVRVRELAKRDPSLHVSAFRGVLREAVERRRRDRHGMP